MLHLILTRFNLRIWAEDKNGNQTFTDEWLRERVILFETYCLPSIMAQTCKDFKWVILFDEETPEWLVEKIRLWRDDLPQIMAISVRRGSPGMFRRIFREVAISEADCRGGRLLTTSLDNDDALSCNFVEKIQQKAKQLDSGTFISYRYGIQYFTGMKLALSLPCTYNHFASYVEDYEKPEDIRTFFRLNAHSHLKNVPRDEVVIVDNKEEPMWLEIVHTSNRSNDVHMAVRLHLITDSGMLEQTFGVKGVELSTHPWRIFCSQYIPRFFRQLKRRLI